MTKEDNEGETPTTTDKDDYEQVTHVTDHVFTSPKPYMTAIIVVVASFLLGLMFEGYGDMTLTLKASVLVFMLPGLLAATLSVPISNGLGGRLYLRRSMLLEVVSLGVMMALWFVWALIRLISQKDLEFRTMELFILTFPFWLWHVVLAATSDRRHARTVWSSGLLPVISIIGLHVLHPLSVGDLFFVAGTLVVMLLSLSVFTNIVRAPIKRNYGYDGMDLVKHMLAHWTEGVTEGVIEMERFFDSFAIEAKVPIGLIAFKRSKDETTKGIFVVPGVHAGPFGHLAGSNMPEKISTLIGKDEKAGTFVMVPHSATTHDVNPSTSNETVKMGAAGRKLLKTVKYSTEATRSSRQTEGISLVSQTFGDTLLMVHDPSPVTRDDLDENIEKEIVKHAKHEGLENTILMDAHNCIERGSEIIHHHTAAGEAVIKMCETAITRSKASKREPVKMGFAQDCDVTVKDHAIGPAGIQAMVLEVAGQKSTYVLIDGNNIVSGLTEKVKKSLRSTVDELVIMTSDDHMANVTMGGFNPIGIKINHKELSDRIKKLVVKALNDLEDVKVGGASGTVQLRVFGPGATSRLMATINSTISVMIYGAMAGLALAFSGTFVWYELLVLVGIR
jgi:putative membrane protein